MLVATFGPSTTWVGKTVTYADGAFVLEGHGPIRAQDVFEYDRLGHLVWTMDGVRAWVGARAQAEGGLAAAPTQTGGWQQESATSTPMAQDAPALQPDDAVAEQPPATDAAEAPPAARVAQPLLLAAAAEPVPPAQAAGPVLAAEAAGPVLAAEPADLAGIATASAVATTAVVEAPAAGARPGSGPVAADEAELPAAVEDAFAGLGADDPARARAIEEAARDHDWLRLAALYSLQAWWLDEEGRDALQVTRLARRAELRAFLDQGITLVRVSPADDDTCDACRRVSGRVMTIADALRLMPIPDASCAYKWCRCVWQLADAGGSQ